MLPMPLLRRTCGFNTQPPEGGWHVFAVQLGQFGRFNTQPPEGGWCPNSARRWKRPVSTHSRLKAAGNKAETLLGRLRVSTHSRLKAAGQAAIEAAQDKGVSTHSRLKAAGPYAYLVREKAACFNTQPPEGGWSMRLSAW